MDTETVFEHDDAGIDPEIESLAGNNVALMRDGVRRILNPHYI